MNLAENGMKYQVGYYKPSIEFSSIPEFMAIRTEEDVLVGVTGPATSRRAALDARLFAAAPEMISALRAICACFPDGPGRTDDPALARGLALAKAAIMLAESGKSASAAET